MEQAAHRLADFTGERPQTGPSYVTGWLIKSCVVCCLHTFLAQPAVDLMCNLLGGIL